MSDEMTWSMPGVRLIAHDPEGGCAECPLLSATGGCAAEKRRLGPEAVMSAPEWCPLREGGVLLSSRRTIAGALLGRRV